MIKRLMRDPTLVFKSHRVRWALAIFLGYWLLTPFVEATALAQLLVLILIPVGLGVLKKYVPTIIDAAVTDDRGPISQLTQGIVLAFFGLTLGLIWTTVARLVPGAEWMSRSPLVGFYLLCSVVAGTLHMTARRDRGGRLRDEDVRDVAIAYAVGLVVALVLMILQLGGVLRG